jgi:hypothetical protein
MEDRMNQLTRWLKDGLPLLTILALAYWLGVTRPSRSTVYAANQLDPQFQLTTVNQTSSLLVYQPDTKTIYVYQGATTGNSAVQCSFKFQLDRPGGVIQRVPCPVASLVH